MAESNNKNTGIVPVDVGRLSGGLQTMFNGMSEVFGSIGAGEEAVSMIRNAKNAGTESRYSVPKRNETSVDKPANSENQKAAEKPRAAESSKKESGNSNLTLADLQKAAGTKIMADRKNQEKIQKIITSFDVTCLSDLPESKYEAFMTQLTTL